MTYELVYAFLISKSHTKAASALKKSLKDDLNVPEDGKGQTLEDAVKAWKVQSLASKLVTEV